MQILHYIDIALEVVGAIGLICSALSKIPMGKASAVLSHMGTNFIAAAREAGTKTPPTRITLPPKG